MRLAALALLLAASLAQRGDGQTAYRASVAAVAGCAAADAWSSYGRVELNPVLAGRGQRFDGRSVAIKAGITGAWLGAQWIWRRNQRAYRVGNWVMAGAWCGAAGWNLTTR